MFLDELREVADQVRRQATKTIQVPGSGGKFAVKFRPPSDRDRLTDVVAAYRVGGALDADQERQLLIDCCDEVLRRDPETGTVEGYDPPLRFDAGDERWGDVKTARECVALLYNLDVQPLAAAVTADNLVDWLQGLDAEIAARVEGKSGSNAAESS